MAKKYFVFTLIKNLIKKIKQIYCKHDWREGYIQCKAKATFAAGQLVYQDDIDTAESINMKLCKKCGKWEENRIVLGIVMERISG